PDHRIEPPLFAEEGGFSKEVESWLLERNRKPRRGDGHRQWKLIQVSKRSAETYGQLGWDCCQILSCFFFLIFLFILTSLSFPLPVSSSLSQHTTVLPFIIIEMRTTHHRYPSRSWGLAAVCCFGIGYILWTCWVHQVTGVWVYPVLERIAPLARVVFFSVMTVIICIFYVLGEILNSYIWDQPHTEKVKGE
ncbi:androgen-dependent TFPI-regulating protein, partial [Stegastes partitus]|uniref:Androgen-dependent TFPI-regulating protein n=1 Tax=Stegastes partitus TaxID=144197 RepID=A0A9Y4TYB9_9TELE